MSDENSWLIISWLIISWLIISWLIISWLIITEQSLVTDFFNLLRAIGNWGHKIMQPVVATYILPDPQILCLRTENNGFVFEEETKHIGHKMPHPSYYFWDW